LYERVAHFNARKARNLAPPSLNQKREPRNLSSKGPVSSAKISRSGRHSRTVSKDPSMENDVSHQQEESTTAITEKLEPSQTQREVNHEQSSEQTKSNQHHVNNAKASNGRFDTTSIHTTHEMDQKQQLREAERKLKEVMDREQQMRERLTAQKQHAEDEYADLLERYNNAKAQVDQLKQFKDEHLYKLDSSTNANSEQIAELQAKLRQVQDSEQAAVETQQMLNEQNQQLRRELTSLKEIQDVPNDKQSELLARIEDYEKQIKDMKANSLEDAKEMNQKFKWYIETHKALKQENSSLQQQLRNLTEASNLESTQNELKRAEEEIDALQQEMNILRESTTQREKDLKSQLRDISLSSSQIMLNQSSILPAAETTSEYVQTVDNFTAEENNIQSDTLKELQKSVSELQHELEELQHKYSSALVDKAKVHVELDNTIEELSTLRLQMEQEKRDPKTPMSPSDDPNIISQSLQEEIDMLRSFCDQAVVHIEKLKAETTNLRSTNETLQKEFNQQQDGNEPFTLAKELSSMQEKHTNLQTQNIDLSHQMEKHENRISHLEDELRQAQNSLSQAKDESNQHLQSLHERKTLISDLSGQIETHQETVRKLTDEHRVEISRLTKQIKDHNEMESTSDMYRKEVDNLQGKLQQTEQKRHQLAQKHATQVESLQSTISQIHDELQSAHGQVDAVHADNAQLERQLQQIQREKQAMQVSLQEAREALATIQDDVASQNSTAPDASVVEFYKGQIERLKQDKVDLQQQLTDLTHYQESTMDQMRSESQSLRKQLREKTTRLEQLALAEEDFQKRLEAQEEELETMCQDKAIVEKQLQALRDTIGQTEDTQHIALRTAHKDEVHKLREKYQEKIQQLKESHEFSLQEYRHKVKQLTQQTQNDNEEEETSGELDEAYKQIEALTHEIDNLKSSAGTVEAVQEQLQALQVEYESLLEHNQSLRDQVLKEARDMQDHVLEKLQEDMKADQANEIKIIRQVIERERKKAQTQIETLKQELVVEREKKDSLNGDISSQIATKDQKIQALQTHIESLEAQHKKEIQHLQNNHEDELRILEDQFNKDLDSIGKQIEVERTHHRIEMDELLNQKNEDLVTYALAADTAPAFELKQLKQQFEQKCEDMERIQSEYQNKILELRAELDVANRAENVVQRYETKISDLNDQTKKKIASLTDELSSVKQLLARSKIERGTEEDIEKLKRELRVEQQAHRTNRSQDMFEISRLRKELADLRGNHEIQLKEYEQKHMEAMEELTRTQNQNTVIGLLKSKLYEERERTKHFEDEVIMSKDQLRAEQRNRRADVERFHEEINHLNEQLRLARAELIELKEKPQPLLSTLGQMPASRFGTPSHPRNREATMQATHAPKAESSDAKDPSPVAQDPSTNTSYILTTPQSATTTNALLQQVGDAFRDAAKRQEEKHTESTNPDSSESDISSENPFMRKIRSQAKEIIALRSKMGQVASPASSSTNQEEIIQKIEVLQHKAEENTLLMMTSFQKQLDDMKQQTPLDTNSALFDKYKVSKSDAVKKAKLLIKEAQESIQSEYEKKIADFKKLQKLELGRVREEYERGSLAGADDRKTPRSRSRRSSSKKKKSDMGGSKSPLRAPVETPPQGNSSFLQTPKTPQSRDDYLTANPLTVSQLVTPQGSATASIPQPQNANSPNTTTNTQAGATAATAFLKATKIIMTQQNVVKRLRRKKRMQHTINDIEFSPDGKILVVGSGNMVIMYDAMKQVVLKRLDPKCSYVGAVAFSPDGKHFASGGSMPQHAVVIWNSEGKGLLRYPNRSFINCLSYNPTYGTLLSGTEFNFGVYSMGWKNVVKYPVESKLMCFSWSCRGNLLALGHESGEVVVRDAITKEPKSGECAYYVLDSVKEGDAISTMSWHPSEDVLAVGCMDKTLSFYRFHNQKLYATGHPRYLGYRPFGMTFVTNGKFMCIGGSNNKACLYSSTGDILMNIMASDRLVKVIVSNPKSDIVAISDHTKIVFADIRERLEEALGQRLYHSLETELFSDVSVRATGE